jgi:HSP20 family protein
MDVCETENGYEVSVALPGVKAEDIDVTVHQNTMTIKGHYSFQNQHDTKHPTQGQTQQQQQRGQHQNWLMREMGTGTFERSITFPKPIDADKISSNFENGVLTMTIPVSESSRPRKISVRSGQSQQHQVSVEAKR